MAWMSGRQISKVLHTQSASQVLHRKQEPQNDVREAKSRLVSSYWWSMMQT